jgi:tripartite-type tricarboxylate transporter receptor subunit TctC
VAKAKPDGYTLFGGTSARTHQRSLYKNLPYDPVKDFEPISLVASCPTC